MKNKYTMMFNLWNWIDKAQFNDYKAKRVILVKAVTIITIIHSVICTLFLVNTNQYVQALSLLVMGVLLSIALVLLFTTSKQHSVLFFIAIVSVIYSLALLYIGNKFFLLYVLMIIVPLS